MLLAACGRRGHKRRLGRLGRLPSRLWTQGPPNRRLGKPGSLPLPWKGVEVRYAAVRCCGSRMSVQACVLTVRAFQF